MQKGTVALAAESPEELFDPRSLYKVKDNHRNKGNVSKSMAFANRAVLAAGGQGSSNLFTQGQAPMVSQGPNDANGTTLFKSKFASTK